MNAVILDNWTFQTIGELFEAGLSAERTQALIVKGKSHAYEPFSVGDLQLKALVDILTNIILRDEILLDRSFFHAWREHAEVFGPVFGAKLVRPTEPPQQGSAIADGTSFIVKELCVTSSLKRIQTVNERHFAKHKTSQYEYQSQIVWGTAGMLSRSNVYNAPYVGHPLRQRFLESTGVLKARGDVVREVVELVKEKRASIYQSSTSTLDVKYAMLDVPAVAAEVVMKATSPYELLSIAIAERDKHKKLRAWFSSFRQAIAEEDTLTVAKHRKELNLLARDMDRLVGKTSAPTFSFSMSLSGPSASLPVGEWVRSFMGRYSIRHDLMKQVTGASGRQASSKLKKMFFAPHA